MSKKGIVVFNTPGANANAVKELVLTGLLLSSRGISEGMNYVRTLTDITDGGEMNKLLEAQKKQFAGTEIAGKTLGVIGLGAIGSMVAEMGLSLGMNVVGYDPALSVDAAWRLPSSVSKMENIQSLLSASDFITLHLPVLETTRDLINNDTLAHAKKGSVLLNFARGEIVNTDAAITALQNGTIAKYVTDFPTPSLLSEENVVLMPHIGASTAEAEENCAMMAVNQLMDFIENGNIINSVNFPAISMERAGDFRITFSNNNVPKVLGNVLSILADNDVNVIDMLNKSRGEYAYNIIDIESQPSEDLINAISEVEGVINVRVIDAA
jgi:D-3-phosphoglycerate dehydrogenase